MAVLGAQLVFSLVIFSFLQKLSCFYSFGRWLLAGRLVRYLHPTDDDLRTAAGIQSSGGTGNNKYKRKADAKKAQQGLQKEETFTIPRSTPIQLDTVRVGALDLIHINYYGEYLWLVDFSMSAFLVYLLTEIYYTLGNWNEMNVSILWCLLAIGFCVRLLINQTATYFRAEDGGERILIFTFGFLYLVLAMGILVVDDSKLEFGLETGYNNFSMGATLLLQKQGVLSAGPVGFLTFKIVLAVFCAIVGALFTFPGLRMAKLHLDSLKYSREQPLKQILLHINFIMPYVLLLLWVRPIGREVLCGLSWKITSRLFTETIFDNFRIVMFAVFTILRLLLLPTHLQSHLNSAHEKAENLRKESGRITNLELQKMIARVFYFVGVIVIQYLTPVFILLFLSFLYKTLGEYSWSATFGETSENYISSFRRELTAANASVLSNNTDSADGIVDKAVKFSLAFSDLRAVFTPVFYRGILSFSLWWVCASWTVAMTFGLYYHSREM